MFLTELLSTRKNLLVAGTLSLLISLVSDSIAFAQNTTNFPTIGRVEQFDPQLEELIAKEAVIQVLSGGFEWSEGPVWVPEEGNTFGGYLLFSDIPHNTRELPITAKNLAVMAWHWT